MEGDDASGYPRDLCSGHGVSFEQDIEHPPGGEAAHAQGVVDNLALTPAEMQGTARIAPQGQDVQIDIGTQAAIETEFFLTKVPPLFESREIGEGKMNCLLELVGKISGEADHGEVGLQDLDLLRTVRKKAGAFQGFELRGIHLKSSQSWQYTLNPLLPRPKGGKDAEGMKKQIPSSPPPGRGRGKTLMKALLERFHKSTLK
jgi:hypothetical protein